MPAPSASISGAEMQALPITLVEARGLLAPLTRFSRVALAVSGGPDSLALMQLAGGLHAELGVSLTVLTVDHGLRDSSHEEAAMVGRQAAALGLPHAILTWEGGESRSASLQARARAARYDLMAAYCHAHDIQALVTAHHLDDQAETVLMRVLSGAGAAGAAGIPPVSGPWVRPLLEVRRTESEAFCRALGLRPRADPTNRDPRYLRNALRLRALPEIERVTGRDVREALARTGALLREDEAELSRQAAEASDGIVSVRGGRFPEEVTLRAAALLDLPAARQAIERKVSDAVQGQVTWEDLGIRLLPLPHGVLRGARVAIPGMLTGSVERIELDPAVDGAERPRVVPGGCSCHGQTLEGDPGLDPKRLGNRSRPILELGGIPHGETLEEVTSVEGGGTLEVGNAKAANVALIVVVVVSRLELGVEDVDVAGRVFGQGHAYSVSGHYLVADRRAQ